MWLISWGRVTHGNTYSTCDWPRGRWQAETGPCCREGTETWTCAWGLTRASLLQTAGIIMIMWPVLKNTTVVTLTHRFHHSGWFGIYKNAIKLSAYHILCFISDCPFVALSKAKFAEKLHTVLSRPHCKAFIVNLLRVLVWYTAGKDRQWQSYCVSIWTKLLS